MSDRQAFNLPYRVLTWLGFWGSTGQNKLIKYWYWLYRLWTYGFLCTFTSFCIVDLYTFRHDVRKVSTNLTATFTAAMLLYKNSIALSKFSKIEAYKEKMKKGLYSSIDSQGENCICHGLKEMRKSCYMVLGLTVVAISCWLMLPFIVGRAEGDRVLPIPVWIPWNFDESPYFEFAFLFQAYGAYLIAIDALSFNLTIFGSIIQICAEYDVLSTNFSKINEWCYSKQGEGARMLNVEENMAVEQMIMENVKHHQKIICSVDEIESFYVHIMGVQLSGSTGLCIVVGIDLIMSLRVGGSRIITLIAVFTLVSVDVTLFCVFGARLKHKASDFLDQFNTIPWEMMNSKNRKSCAIIIMRAQRSPVMTIEKFITIDLVTLVSLFRIIYNVIYFVLYVTDSK